MDSIPADLLEIKYRFDSWRASRKHIREPIPHDLRQDAARISRRYPYSLVRNTLKIDPRRFLGSAQATRAVSRKKPQNAFFKLRPADLSLQDVTVSSSQHNFPYRLQLERPDGSRLTLTLPNLDTATLNSLCRDFLRE